MKSPRLTHLLVPILLLSFSDCWAQQDQPVDPTGALKLVEIERVLALFEGNEETRPIQRQDRWCWAATAEIIMSSYGLTAWKQCIQADDAYPGKSLPRTCCDYPESPLCNRTGWPRFDYYGFNSESTPAGTALEWSQLKLQMDQRQPVAVALRFRGRGGGHMGVVAGYAEMPGGEHLIFVIDPDGFHSGMWALFDDLFEDSSNDWEHWRTYYNIRPLLP